MTEDAKAAVEWLRAVPPKAIPYVYGGADAAADAREEARCRRQNEVRQHMLALLALLDAVTAERDALRAQVERLTSAVPGLAESGPYTLADVERIEAHRGKPYARLRATVEQVERVRAVMGTKLNFLRGAVLDALNGTSDREV